MIPFERQQRILQFLEGKNPASMEEIARNLYVSNATVRRDVAAMEEKGLVKRIYGGVLLSGRVNEVIPLDLRDGEHAEIKDLLAKKASETVFDGATILLDASSTVYRMMRYLKKFKNLKIITNNLRILNHAEQFNGTIYCTGGTYDPKNQVLYGPFAEQFLEGISADLFFFSSQGITEDGEITDPSEAETVLRKKMLRRARKSYFLCDGSKIGKQNLFTLCTKDEVSGIFCDQSLPWNE